MINVSVTADTEKATDFIVKLTGKIERPKALNDALGRQLARDLQSHFKIKNRVPNNLRGKKTNFWQSVSKATVMTEATDNGATVTIGESRFRIHLQGGVIKPTGGRKALTIPLVADAHGKRVREYEQSSGKKLFRMGGALFERSSKGDRSLTGATRVSTRNRAGQTRSLNLRGKSQVRAVYALAKSVTIKADPTALPDPKKLLLSLNDTAEKWLAAEIKKGGAA